MTSSSEKCLTVVMPEYFPPLSTLARVLASDVTVWADTFLFSKQTTMNRARIKTVAGPEWLTIPVRHSAHENAVLSVKIDPEHHWRHNHCKSLQVNYMNSPYYFFLQSKVDSLVQEHWSHLEPLIFKSFQFLCRRMRISAKVIKSSNMPTVSDRSERVCAWLETADCSHYLIDAGHLHFLDQGLIFKNGFKIIGFDFVPPVYPQVYHDFFRDLSGLDLLFNVGEQSRSILKKNSFIFPVSD